MRVHVSWCQVASLVLFLGLYGATANGQVGPSHELTSDDLQKEFPIVLQVEKSEMTSAESDPVRLSNASSMGMAPPVFGAFFGTLNGERHWHFGCMAENTRRELIPCRDMPIGLHRARWVHNRELLEIFTYDSTGDVTLRYIDATIDLKNPPPADDPVQSLPSSGGFLYLDQTAHNYPLLVHVYGAVSLSFQAGQWPVQTNCEITSPFPNRTNVNCRQLPPVPINRGVAEVQASIDGKLKSFSCEAKWRWTQCSVLAPGFYQARWKDDRQTQIEVLGLRDGKAQEVGYEVR